MKRFRGGLVLKAYRLLYHSTLGLIVIKKKTHAGKSDRAAVHSTRRSAVTQIDPLLTGVSVVVLHEKYLVYVETFRLEVYSVCGKNRKVNDAVAGASNNKAGGQHAHIRPLCTPHAPQALVIPPPV